MNSIIDGNLVGNYKVGASIALLSIVTVFVVLLLIIIICDLLSKAIEKNTYKKKQIASKTTTNKSANTLNLNDEDALVACLIASIEMRNLVKKDVKVINVRRVD